MSLTSHLDNLNSPFRQFLHSEFPNTRVILRECRSQIGDSTTIKPSETLASSVYGLLGAALDYRARYYFTVTPYTQLVAWNGARLATNGRLTYDEQNKIASVAPAIERWRGNQFLQPEGTAEFFTMLQAEIQGFRPVNRRLESQEESRLARYCIVLALFETVFRSGIEWSPSYVPEPRHTAEKFLAIPDQIWVDDLCQMSWALHEQLQGMFEKPAVLNPTFAGSADVGGADADLIVDGCLIDIKATINPRKISEWLYQLLGYVLLDYHDRYEIQSVAIYLVRQQTMLQWPLNEFLTKMAGDGSPALKHVRIRFQDIAKTYQNKMVTGG